MAGPLTSAARAVSPRHRRWKRLLHGLTLDPAQLSRPVRPPGEGDFIICGPSRSGTTLLSAVLHQPPRVVTVVEPWDGMRLAPDSLFASLRKEMRDTGGLRRGKLDTDRLEGDQEVLWRSEGSTVPLEVEDGYLLGVKWPAFWRYLELLPTTKFLVCLRDPYQVVASFKRVGGRLGEGLDYDIAFNKTMNRELVEATSEPEVRRALLFEYVTSRVAPFLSHRNVLPVRYERWFEEPDALLEDVGAFVGIPLRDLQVRLRPPQDDTSLSSRERDLVRNLCPSAEAIGYAL